MTAVHAGSSQAKVTYEEGEQVFDAVVLATHSDTALQLRGADATELEAEVLQAIPYHANDVYLHTGAHRHWNICCSHTHADTVSDIMQRACHALRRLSFAVGALQQFTDCIGARAYTQKVPNVCRRIADAQAQGVLGELELPRL
jgi:predicted NAD/FAD-binding protein